MAGANRAGLGSGKLGDNRAAEAPQVIGLPLALGLAIVVPGSAWSPYETEPPHVAGSLSPIAAGVEARTQSLDFAPVTAVVPIATGDRVRTDATGFAEISYDDGSRTRLDVSTEFEVVEMVDDAGETSTRTEMGLGRTWHRVESLGEGGFVVETSQATATVLGTAFAIDCPAARECSYLVVDGTLALALPDGSAIELAAPSAVDVVDGVAGEIVPVPFDAAFGDPWLSNNAVRDVAAGFAEPAALYVAHGAAYASIAGTYAVTGTVTDVSCDAQCLPGTQRVGDTIEFSYSVDSGSLEGTSYTWTNAGSVQPCGWDDDGDGAVDRETGSLAGTDSFTITPTAVALRGGGPLVTAFTGTLTTSYSVASGDCFDGVFLRQSVTATISGSR